MQVQSYSFLKCATSRTGTLERIISNNNVFWKQKTLKRTNYIHEFEGYFLRGWVSSNGFEVFNGCIFEAWILLVSFSKQLVNPLFSKNILID